ncbi:MAG TPA: EamA family transporter RarD [Caldilineae bacterium]|nr:EamA family transporter RarD [Caldilineae bacterium]
MRRGLAYAIGAYVLWGFFPVYWKALQAVPAAEIVLHRIVWSLVFLVILLAVRRQWAWLSGLRSQRQTLLILAVSAGLLAVNWLTYVWGVTHGFVVETSLGYFINPLFSVLLGVVFLKERLRLWQWTAVGLATLGVLYLTFGYGSFPWIALTLALTFGVYGLLQKKVRLESTESLAGEMAILALPALLLLASLTIRGDNTFLQTSPTTILLLIGTGAVTAVPLIFFGAGARLIPLSTIGLLQYIAPTIQFLLGVFLYHEPFTTDRLIGFSLIWLALAIFALDNARNQSKNHRARKQSMRPAN